MIDKVNRNEIPANSVISTYFAGKWEVEAFLKTHQLKYTWEAVRNKVMNERVKRQRLVKKRADSFK